MLIDSLSKTPFLLRAMLSGIPNSKLKEPLKPGKWTIHEHVCHLSQAEKMIGERFEKFHDDPAPEFHPYLPGTTEPDDQLIKLDMQRELDVLESARSELVSRLQSFDPAVWSKKAVHDEYYDYDPLILLRHTLMHDHFHMYRIEELWLTKPEFL